jgi:UDP-N-acetylmuramoylalanine--D-glutamate ligase
VEILVAGIGRSGIASANYLSSKGHKVTITDAKTIEQLSDQMATLDKGVTVMAGGHEGITGEFDILVTSPGIPWDAEILTDFRNRGIPVISEVELAFTEYEREWVAITGTNGKTTTTSLVGEMLKTAGIEAVVCGNIGNPVIGEPGLAKEGTVIVAEISSFQLEGVNAFAPRVAAILNITPDHLDRHGTIENYIAVKSRVFKKQDKKSFCVLNMDDPQTANLQSEVPSSLFGFSAKKPLTEGVYMKDGKIILSTRGGKEVLGDASDLLLIGITGQENGLAACAIAHCAGADTDSIRRALFSFTGLAHRMEVVAESEGIRYINDSKATNVNAALKGIEGIEGNFCAILGGRDKEGDYTPLVELVRERSGSTVLIGEASEKIAAAFGDYGKLAYASSMDEAVEKAATFLALGGEDRGTVILSPACASFDMFLNYEDRGRAFVDAVKRHSSNTGVAHA